MINDLFDNSVPFDIQYELEQRSKELSALEKGTLEMGTTVPNLYGALGKFIANPSTVSVETYKRILDTDETVGSGLDFMNLCMIARWGEYKHKNQEIQKFVRRALQMMEGSWHQNLDDMLSAEWAGFSVTEKVWKMEKDFDGKPAYVPRKLVTYPPLTIVFAVDRSGDVLPDGIYQYQRYYNSVLNNYNSGILGRNDRDGFRPDLYAASGDFPYPIRVASDISYLTVKIPKEKCIHLTSSSTGRFNNPYGRSILRRSYKNWVLKDAFLKMWLVAADKKGTPLVVGYAAPNDTVLEGKTGEKVRSDLGMANTLKNMHNSSFIVLPGMKGETYDIEAIQSQGDLNVFKDGIDYFNKALMRSMLIPSLVMTGGDGAGSYALGQEHHKVFAKIIDGKLKPYKETILTDLIEPLIAYNFPRAIWEKDGVGDFALDEFDPELLEKMSTIYANLTNVGYMAPEEQQDMDVVREKMGLGKGKARKPIDPIEELTATVDELEGGDGTGKDDDDTGGASADTGAPEDV